MTSKEEQIKQWLTTTSGFVEGLMSIEDLPAKLADYQIRLMRDPRKFRVIEKARGVGFSFGCAAEALAKAHLKKNYTAIFVSMNLEEAIEKIRYANLLYESMPLRWRKKKVVDNKMTIEFEDASGRNRARLISHPCKDPRGKHNADVYLDEFAHYGGKQRPIYVAAVPIVSRGNGQLTIGSTPLAAGDLFHDIIKQERKKYQMFTRHAIPWWLCTDLCENVEKASIEAPGLPTSERVHRFGKEVLIDIFYSLEPADFQQEYELLYADEATSYFPYELLFSCCSDNLKVSGGVESLVSDCSGEFYAGFDVGRTRNKSELIVLERVKKRLYYRYGKEFDRSKFKYQEEFLRKMLKRSKRFRRLCIDKHGIGMNLAENLHSEFRSRAEGIALYGQMKESLAVDTHITFENEAIVIPRDRQLMQQIHSIKKTATEAGYSRYDTERNESHHADKMWALALAIHAAGGQKRKRKKKSIDVSIV